MEIQFKELLHQRIIDNCMKLFEIEEYGCCAHKATIQVETALKEKGGITNKKLFGRRLINHLLKNGESIRMKVPLGDDLQEDAKELFSGVFAYYRNYSAHDGSKIDRNICARILIITSDLLDLLDASVQSVECTVDCLIKEGIFENKKDVADLLHFLHNQQLPYEISDGFFEDLAHAGYGKSQLDNVIEYGLIEYKREWMDHRDGMDDWDYFGWFEATPEGASVMDVPFDQLKRFKNGNS